MNEHRTFEELVSYCTWLIIEAITHGKPLRSAVWGALDYARRWSPK